MVRGPNGSRRWPPNGGSAGAERLEAFDGRSSLHGWLCGIARNKLRAQRRRHTLVRVEEEDPLGVQAVQRGLALRGVVVERALHDEGAALAGDGAGIIVAARVQDHDAVHPRAQAVDAVAARALENARKNGDTRTTYEQIQRRVAAAVERGDQRRNNNNR